MGLQDLLRYVVLYSADSSALHRLDYWLAATLGQLTATYPCTLDAKARFGALLAQTARLCEFMQTTLPGVDRFLVDYVLRWNGVDFRREVLALIVLMPPLPFEVLYMDMLRPLYTHFVTGSSAVRCDLVRCFTGIISRYAEYDWVSNYSNRAGRENKVCQLGFGVATLRARVATRAYAVALYVPCCSSARRAVSPSRWGSLLGVDQRLHSCLQSDAVTVRRLQARSFEDIAPVPEADYMRTIFDLLDFTDCACAMATMLEKQNMAIYAAILSFYECVKFSIRTSFY